MSPTINLNLNVTVVMSVPGRYELSMPELQYATKSDTGAHPSQAPPTPTSSRERNAAPPHQPTASTTHEHSSPAQQAPFVRRGRVGRPPPVQTVWRDDSPEPAARPGMPPLSACGENGGRMGLPAQELGTGGPFDGFVEVPSAQGEHTA